MTSSPTMCFSVPYTTESIFSDLRHQTIPTIIIMRKSTLPTISHLLVDILLDKNRRSVKEFVSLFSTSLLC